MQLPVMPPVKPMLAKSVPSVPQGDYLYEPKWGAKFVLSIRTPRSRHQPEPVVKVVAV